MSQQSMGIPIPDSALRVEIALRTTAEGGRRGPVNLRDHVYHVLAAGGTYAAMTEELRKGIPTPKLFGLVLVHGPPLVWPGETVVAIAFPRVHEAGARELLDAGVFTLFEGARLVGYGRVLGRLKDLA